MKKHILAILLVLSGFATIAQNVSYQIYTTRYYTGRGNSDFWTSDDPRWVVLFYHSADGYAAGQGVIRTIDNGLDGPAWDDPTDFLCRTETNTSSTGIRVNLSAWEDDACGGSDTYDTGCANNDEAYCTITSSTINFRNDPICNWNSYNIFCNSNWQVDYRIRWEWAGAPAITSQPSPNDRNLCVGTGTTITVVGDASARFYQWQVNTNTGAPQAGCASTGWSNISGATSSSYTPPQTPGARQYRVLITSNCSADFTSKTTTSNCVRVNYFAYSPPIISSACGNNISLGSTQNFAATLPPTVGAIGNGSYTWTVSPAGPSIATPSASSTNITFPSDGSYTITLTTDDSGGPCGTATTTCTVNVSSPDCDFVYVNASTSNTLVGSSNSPVTLAAGIALASGSPSRKHIRMASGTYTSTSILDIPSNVIIEGGYVQTGNNWTKSSAAVTTINFTSAAVSQYDNNTRHVIGFRSAGTTNWTLQDLTITTAAASGTSTNGNGTSNYAVYTGTGSTGWTISRCNITSGAASSGATGAAGNVGGGGSQGNFGSNGSCDCYWGCGACGGGGGGAGGSAGGGAGTGPNGGGVAQGTNGAGGNGGSGGSGGAGSAGQCSGTNTGSGGNGVAGNNGSNGVNSGANGATSGGAGGAGNVGTSSSCANGNNGFTGTAGGDGGVGTAGSTPGTDTYSAGYFLPSYGTNGGGGGGGKGGGGGEGGSGSTDSGTCDRDGGQGGAGGSGGGGGGAGGYGGGGGGGSFGVFIWGGSGTINNTAINTGSAGSGGTGGAGGAGGTGPAGRGVGTGNCGSSDSGEGGASGKGGNGGTGGAGGTGRAGVRFAVGVQNSGSVTYSSISPAITSNSSVSGGSVSNPTNALIVEYDNTKGCTNSYIDLVKTTGTWNNYGTDGDEVNDITSSLSSQSTANNTVSVFYTSTGWKDIGTTSDSRTRMVFVSTSRTPPVINGISSPMCADGSLSLTVTPNSPSSVVAYEWTVQATPVTGLATPAATLTSSSATPTFVFPNAGSTNITYQIKLRVQDQCCGWSIPVYGFVTVTPDPLPPTATRSPTDATICEGQTLTLTSPTLGAGGTGTCSFEYRYNDGSGFSTWSSTVPSFAAVQGTNTIEIRTNCNGNGCDISTATAYSWTVVADPAIPAATRSPNMDTVCVGASLTLTGVAQGQGGTGTCVLEYASSTNGGSTYSAWSTTLPTITATGTDNRIKVRTNCSGLGCGTSPEAVFVWNVKPDPIAPTITKNPSDATVCIGAVLAPNITAFGTGGAGTCQDELRFSADNGANWSAWSTSVPSVTTTVAGTFLIEARRNCGASGCNSNVNQISWTVVADPTISAPTFNPTTICAGGTTVVSATITGGTGTNNPQWQYFNGSTWNDVVNNTPTGATYSNATTLSMTIAGITATGSHQYRLTTNNAQACNNQGAGGSLTVVADPVWASNTVSPGTICVGGSVTFSATVSGGSGGTVSWVRATTPGGAGTTVTSPNTPPSTGTYYYRPVYTGTVSGCNLADGTETAVTVVADPVWATNSVSAGPLCLGASVTFSATVSGGSGGSVSWVRATTPGGAGTTVTSPNIPPSAGTYYYRPVYTGSVSGCNLNDGTETAVVIAADPIISTQPASGAACYNGTYNLSVTATGGVGTFSYQWQESTTGCGGSWTNVGTNATTHVTPIITATRYYRVIVSQSGSACDPITSNCATVTTQTNLASSTWNGSVSTDWYNPANWSNCVPGNNTDAIIPAGMPRYPIIVTTSPLYTGNATCKTINIANGAAVDIKGNAILDVLD